MINELIEKEIEKRIGHWEKMAKLTFEIANGNEEMCAMCGINPSMLRSEYKEFAQIIAKEVAMRFQSEKIVEGLTDMRPGIIDTSRDALINYDRGRNYNIDKNNKLANQIINEVYNS